jgi:cyclic pyranopterin phosphate synthase
MTNSPRLIDSHGRVMRDLRVSVTDRCNFRCLYCLPETEAAANFYRGRWGQKGFHAPPIAREWQPKQNILTFEEIEQIVRVAVDLGIDKIRLTGGEPLLRRDLPRLVERLARLEGIKDLALTTNGFHFKERAQAFRDAGLTRISFSLDSLDPANFRKMTGRDGLGEVLEGIAAATAVGLTPVKVNAVVIRGINDHEVEALAEYASREKFTMRFIEFMPLDSARAWLKDLVVPGHEILSRLQARFTLHPVVSKSSSETAKRWQIDNGCEIGIIAPVSEPFCGHCNRIRLTADGKIRTCLFSVAEHDLRTPMRQGAGDQELKDLLQSIVFQKEARHHIGEPEFVPPSRSMSCIGG